MIPRILESTIFSKLNKGKCIIIYGARQVGKTTIAKSISNSSGIKSLWLNCDEPDIRETLTSATSAKLRLLIGNHRLVIIDEAQRVENIGLTLKLFTDSIPEVQVIATGSASFELASKTSEALTGRKYEFLIYPLSFAELTSHHGLLHEKRLLEHRLVFGSYPEIVTRPGEEKELLKLLASSYLYKDILTFEKIKKPALAERLVKALALQVGSEVSYNELSSLLGADKNTIEKYITILEKAFIIFRMPSYSRNIRSEIRHGKKIYFYDNGLLNAVIGNFNPIEKRNDIGILWENYFICERVKYFNNRSAEYTPYFWRTSQQQEIDLIEQTENALNAFEIKWNCRGNFRLPVTFSENYKIAGSACVDKNNYENFLH